MAVSAASSLSDKVVVGCSLGTVVETDGSIGVPSGVVETVGPSVVAGSVGGGGGIVTVTGTWLVDGCAVDAGTVLVVGDVVVVAGTGWVSADALVTALGTGSSLGGDGPVSSVAGRLTTTVDDA